jgi:hypothetical protein
MFRKHTSNVWRVGPVLGSAVWVSLIAVGPTRATASNSIDRSITKQINQPEPEWLTVVNLYRASAGIGPATENLAASAGAKAHADYLVKNRAGGHDEYQNRPGFSREGLRAGQPTMWHKDPLCKLLRHACRSKNQRRTSLRKWPRKQ